MKKRANLFDAQTHLELALPEPRQAEAKPPIEDLRNVAAVWIPEMVIDSNIENTERRIFSTSNFWLYVILGEQYIET